MRGCSLQRRLPLCISWMKREAMLEFLLLLFAPPYRLAIARGMALREGPEHAAFS